MGPIIIINGTCNDLAGSRSQSIACINDGQLQRSQWLQLDHTEVIWWQLSLTVLTPFETSHLVHTHVRILKSFIDNSFEHNADNAQYLELIECNHIRFADNFVTWQVSAQLGEIMRNAVDTKWKVWDILHCFRGFLYSRTTNLFGGGGGVYWFHTVRPSVPHPVSAL